MPEVTLEGVQHFRQAIAVEKLIDLSKHVVDRDVSLQIEVIEQQCRCRLGAHHDEIFQSPHNQANQRTCRAATQTFSTALADSGPSRPMRASWRYGTKADGRRSLREGRIGRSALPSAAASNHVLSLAYRQTAVKCSSPFSNHLGNAQSDPWPLTI